MFDRDGEVADNVDDPLEDIDEVATKFIIVRTAGGVGGAGRRGPSSIDCGDLWW